MLQENNNSEGKSPSKIFPVMYSPKNWGTLERFTRFYHTTYELDHQARKRVPGVEGHFLKAQRIVRLAKEIAPRLSEDEEHLKAHGFTPAERGHELAALIETAFLELYSTLDCFRYVLCGIYRKHRGLKDSTRSLFQNAFAGKLPATLPPEVTSSLKQTETWYPELLKLRDELTHASTGFASRDEKSQTITYFHPGIERDGRCLVIEDAFAKTDLFAQEINHLLGVIFQYLWKTLEETPSTQTCGIFDGRIYQRVVKPSEVVDFHGGVCKSIDWFELEGNPPCPLRIECGAFARAKQALSRTSIS